MLRTLAGAMGGNVNEVTQESNEYIPIIVPPNAFLAGTGWKCDRGFRRLGESCAPIKLPENSYLTGSSYNTGWECNRGFKSDGEACVEISVPEGGYLSESISAKKGWQCLRRNRLG